MRFFTIPFCLLLLAACGNADQNKTAATGVAPGAATDSTALTTIQWLDSTHQNLGKINEGQVVEVVWRFRNSGSKPLIITNASASCGCTVAEKPEAPIAPGGEGSIKAKFDSKGREGTQRKDVYINANTRSMDGQDLSFSVEVSKKNKHTIIMMHIYLLQAQAPGFGGFQFIFLGGMILVFWLFFIRPQAKKAKEQKTFIDNMGKGEKVVTIAGIHGTINKVNEDGTVQLEINPGSYIKIEKQAISLEWTKALNKATTPAAVAEKK